MPINHISSPAQAAPVDRLTLGLQWMRPGATGIEGKVSPSYSSSAVFCFEGSGE